MTYPQTGITSRGTLTGDFQTSAAKPSNPAASVDSAANASAIAIIQAADNATAGINMYGISADAKQAINAARDSIKLAVGAIQGSEDEARRHLANKDLYPEGRQERAQAARQQGQDYARQAFASAEANAAIAEAFLIGDSAPAWGSTDREANNNKQLARADARMVLDSANAKNLPSALQSIAQLDSPMSTLVTSEWVDLYLQSRGIAPDEAKAMRDLATNAALTARAARGNVSAQLVFAVRKGIRGSLGAGKSLAANRARRHF